MTMPAAWTEGYNWMKGEGPCAAMKCVDALAFLGYDLGSYLEDLFHAGGDAAAKELVAELDDD